MQQNINQSIESIMHSIKIKKYSIKQLYAIFKTNLLSYMCNQTYNGSLKEV